MNFLEKKNKLLTSTTELIKILDNPKFEGYSNTVKNSVERFNDEIQKELLFKVLCLGEFNAGKSTFLNNFFPMNPSMEYCPGPAINSSIKTKRYTNASSPTAIEAPWTLKNATHMVNNMGITARRVRKPKIKAIEQISSPKMASISDILLPTPMGSGN